MSEEMNDTFWMVFLQGGGPPTYCHETPEIAREEARRLSRNYPGKKAYVLELVFQKNLYFRIRSGYIR